MTDNAKRKADIIYDKLDTIENEIGALAYDELKELNAINCRTPQYLKQDRIVSLNVRRLDAALSHIRAVMRELNEVIES